jgi:hypothetical protein
VMLGQSVMSYEEEDTRMVCHMRRTHAVMLGQSVSVI